MSKQVVKYNPVMGVVELTYGGVMLYPIDHPSPRVSNETACFTSKVISWNKETGAIETQNTFYSPKETD